MCWPHLLSPTCVTAKLRLGTGVHGGARLTLDEEGVPEATVRAFLSCSNAEAPHASTLALLLRGVGRSKNSSSTGSGPDGSPVTSTCPMFVCFWAGSELVLRPFTTAFSTLSAQSAGASSCRDLLSAATARGATAAACIPTWFMSNPSGSQRQEAGVAADWCAAPLLCYSATETDALLSQQAELAQLAIPILRDEAKANDEPAAKRTRRYPPRPRKLCKNCIGCDAAACAARAAAGAATLATKAAALATTAVRSAQQHESQKALLSDWCREWEPAVAVPDRLPYPVVGPLSAQNLCHVATVAAHMQFEADGNAGSQSVSCTTAQPGANPGSTPQSMSSPALTEAVPTGLRRPILATATAAPRLQSVSKAEEKMLQAKQQQKNRRKEALRMASAQGGSRNRRLQRLQGTGGSCGTATPTDRRLPCRAAPANVALQAGVAQRAAKERSTPLAVVSAGGAVGATPETQNKARLKTQLKRFLRERLPLTSEAEQVFFRSVYKMAMQTCLLFMNELQSLGGSSGSKRLKVEAIEQLVADHGLHVVQQMQSMRPASTQQ